MFWVIKNRITNSLYGIYESKIEAINDSMTLNEDYQTDEYVVREYVL